MGRYKPDWLETPSGEMMQEAYPKHAAFNDISGSATIVCTVGMEGRLHGCKVVAESPKGEGFGAAALQLSSLFRMIPPDTETATPPSVTVPVRFQPSQDPFVPPSLPSAHEAGILLIAIGLGALALLLLLNRLLAPPSRRRGARAAARP